MTKYLEGYILHLHANYEDETYLSNAYGYFIGGIRNFQNQLIPNTIPVGALSYWSKNVKIYKTLSGAERASNHLIENTSYVKRVVVVKVKYVEAMVTHKKKEHIVVDVIDKNVKTIIQ